MGTKSRREKAEAPETRMKERPWMYAAVSAAILIPCFWQSRLQAGDLASHLYNAWLARLVEQGQAPGLAIARQSTNVLFDLLLKFLFEQLGAEAAQQAMEMRSVRAVEYVRDFERRLEPYRDASAVRTYRDRVAALS